MKLFLQLLPILFFIQFTTVHSLFAQNKQPQIKNTPNGKVIVYPDGRTVPYSLSGETPNVILKNNPSQTYPVFNAEITPLDNPISVTEEDLANIAFRRAQISQQAKGIAQARALKATQKRRDLELKLRKARNAAEKTKLEQELETAKIIEEEAIGEYDQAQNLAEEADLFAKGGNYVEAFLQERATRQLALKYNQLEGINSSIGLPLPIGESYISPVPKLTQLEPYCRVEFDGTDESSGRWRKELSPAPVFSFTDERLRSYLKDEDYLRCEGFLSTTGGFTYLTLDFDFAYPNAREAYGIIEESSILTIKLLNGHYINLLSGNMSEGSYDTETQQLTYQVRYLIDRSQLNILKRSEVEAILVFWSTGFEEYPVYQMDFFIRQLNCLD